MNEWATIMRKNGEETRKRSIIIRDASNRSIELTLWGGFVETPGNQLDQVLGSVWSMRSCFVVSSPACVRVSVCVCVCMWVVGGCTTVLAYWRWDGQKGGHRHALLVGWEWSWRQHRAGVRVRTVPVV